MSTALAASWEAALTKAVGANLCDQRHRQRMTVQALADRCAELGVPLGRVTITKLERGIRERVSVAQLFVIAEALDVPALELLFPPAAGGTAEVLPGRHMASKEAARWFTGTLDAPLLGEIREQVAHLSKLVSG